MSYTLRVNTVNEIRDKELLIRLIELTWLGALGVALVFAALTTDRRARQVEEYPTYCDPFGYLQMAQEIREAAAAGKTPKFTLESEHTKLLIEFMQSHHVPLPLWDEMVAPLAYHYFPTADHLAVQYSPGAGLALAVFPEGRALHGLNRVVTLIFLTAGLIMLGIAAVKRRPLAAGFFILALVLGLEILAQLDNASFSMNTLLAPLLLSGMCLAAVWALDIERAKTSYLAWSLTLLAGLLFGFAILARAPVVLLLPGVLVLLWPRKFRAWYKGALVAFILGVFLGGILPMTIHQSRVAGAWYLPTYGHENSAPPTLEYFWRNASFYFGPGKSSTENWAMPAVFAGFVGLLVCSTRKAASEDHATFVRRLSWTRLLTAGLLMLGFSNAYFLTHEARAHYYPWPAMFGAVLLLAFGAFALENQTLTNIRERGSVRQVLVLLGLTLSLVPGAIAITRVGEHYTPRSTEVLPRKFSLPAELADDSAWIWAGELTGTLWYYARKPSHKIGSTNAQTRRLVYEFVKERGEPQFVIVDPSIMQALADEMVQFGATLERRGEVDGCPYFLVHWPPSGPLETPIVR